MSNESVPPDAFNGGANPGFDNGGSPVVHANYDQFVIVPEPSSLALFWHSAHWPLLGSDGVNKQLACGIAALLSRNSRS